MIQILRIQNLKIQTENQKSKSTKPWITDQANKNTDQQIFINSNNL